MCIWHRNVNGCELRAPAISASWLIFLMEFQCYFNGMPNDKSTQPIQMRLLAEILFTYPQNERKSICDQNDQSRRMKTVRICNVFWMQFVDRFSFIWNYHSKGRRALATKLVTRQLHGVPARHSAFDSIPIYGQLIDYAPKKNHTVRNQLLWHITSSVLFLS